MKRLLLLTLILFATATAPARAELVTRTYDIVGSQWSFSDGINLIEPPPFDYLRISFTLTFDPDYPYFYDWISDFSINHVNIDIGSPIMDGPVRLVNQGPETEFSIFPHYPDLATELLVTIVDPGGDWWPRTMNYSNSAFYGSAQTIEAVPESGTLALLATGLLALTLHRRRN